MIGRAAPTVSDLLVNLRLGQPIVPTAADRTSLA